MRVRHDVPLPLSILGSDHFHMQGITIQFRGSSFLAAETVREDGIQDANFGIAQANGGDVTRAQAS